MAELRLDIRNGSEEALAADLMQIVDDEADIEIEEESTALPDLDIEDRDDDDDGPSVVTSHQLSQILDIGPSFALPPIEELFYAVAGLLSNKSKAKPEVTGVEKRL
jgi:NET1-associated nuclear protein 1 (U3 small nucleolar RNA-associated protein 17)